MMSLTQSWAYQFRLPVTLGCCILAWVLAVFSQPLIREGTAADFQWDVLGWSLLLTGMAVRFWATLCIAGRKRKSLVDFGPYSLCRNPLYMGTLLIALAVMAFFKSPTFTAVGLLPLAIYLTGVVPMEEKYLRHKLGSDYDPYCQRVPRWCPNLARYQPPSEPLNFTGRAVLHEARSLFFCALLLPWGVNLSCFVRGQGWLGYWWPLP